MKRNRKHQLFSIISVLPICFLFTIPSIAGSPITLLDARGEVVPAFDPGDDSEIFFYDGTNVVQLTENSYDDLKPRMNDSGEIVWQTVGSIGYSPENMYSDEILFYDGVSTTRITEDDYADSDPQINSSGQIVWSGWDGNDYEIYLFDGINIIQITDTDDDERQPQINENGQVVWSGWDGNDYEIYLFDGITAYQITDDNFDDRSPGLNNSGQVVWEKWETISNTEIFFYNGAIVIQLTDNDYDDLKSQINDDGEVVWYGDDNDVYPDIFHYDGTSVSLINGNSKKGFDPNINDSGEVVWVGIDDQDNHQIYFLNGGGITQLTSTVFRKSSPQLNNNGQVAWQEYDGNDSEIFFFDGTDIIRLTDNDYLDQSPQLADNGELVWYGSDSAFTFGPIVPGGGLDLSGMSAGGGGCMISCISGRYHLPDRFLFLAILGGAILISLKIPNSSMQKEAKMKFRRLFAIILICMYATGCSVYMAAKQPDEKDVSVFNRGTPRAHVIAECGSPIHTMEEEDGSKTDIFVFVQGYSKGEKAGRAIFHGAADFLTLGLWEVLGTPIEAVADGTRIKVKVEYDINDRVEKISALAGEEKLATVDSMGEEGIPGDARAPGKSGNDPVASSFNDPGKTTKLSLAANEPVSVYNPEKPWTGHWQVEGSMHCSGNWRILQTGKAVISTENSSYEIKGRAEGRVLNGKIQTGTNTTSLSDIKLTLSSDRLSFKGTIDTPWGSHALITGKRQ